MEEEEKKIEEAAEGVDENILAAARREVLEGQEHLTEEQKQTRLASNLKSKIDELETLQRKQQAAKKMAEVLKAGKKAKNFEEEKQMLAEIQRDIPEEVLEIM